MKTSKLSIIKDYDSLDDDFKKQVKLVYPNGFTHAIIEFTNNKKKVNAIRFETGKNIYLLRLSKKMMIQIMEENNDFEDDYNYY